MSLKRDVGFYDKKSRQNTKQGGRHLVRASGRSFPAFGRPKTEHSTPDEKILNSQASGRPEAEPPGHL